MKTCRHFRFQIPREDADELRDADPQPCEVCDALPHRRAIASNVAPASKCAATPRPVLRFEPPAARRFNFRQLLATVSCWFY